MSVNFVHTLSHYYNLHGTLYLALHVWLCIASRQRHMQCPS